MELKSILQWLGAIIISLGGSTFIIIAIAKWFGDWMANKLLEKDKAKYVEELENLKSKYGRELEIQKANLEKSNSLFFRYSEHQFSLYNELWKSLCDLQQAGNELWGLASTETLKKFSNQLYITKLQVKKSALLIEDKHYRELLGILERFENFEIGKIKLISLRDKGHQDISLINNLDINHVIRSNELTKNEFEKKINELIRPFKKQIKGE